MALCYMTWTTSFYFEMGYSWAFNGVFILFCVSYLAQCLNSSLRLIAVKTESDLELRRYFVLWIIVIMNHCLFWVIELFLLIKVRKAIFNSSLSLSNSVKRGIAIVLGRLSVSWKQWKSEISYCCFYLALKPEFFSSCRHFKETHGH